MGSRVKSRYDRVSDAVWKLLKYTRIIEEEEEEARRTIAEEDEEEAKFNTERDIFLTPPQSPRSLNYSLGQIGIVNLEDSNRLHRLYTPERAGRMLVLHCTIVDDLLDPHASAPLGKTRPTVSRWKLQSVYTPANKGSPGKTVFTPEGHKKKKINFPSGTLYFPLFYLHSFKVSHEVFQEVPIRSNSGCVTDSY
jgi:hypothetical protein